MPPEDIIAELDGAPVTPKESSVLQTKIYAPVLLPNNLPSVQLRGDDNEKSNKRCRNDVIFDAVRDIIKIPPLILLRGIFNNAKESSSDIAPSKVLSFAQWHPTQPLMVVATTREIYLWDASTRKLCKPELVMPSDMDISCLSFSQFRTLAIGTMQGNILFYDLTSTDSSRLRISHLVTSRYFLNNKTGSIMKLCFDSCSNRFLAVCTARMGVWIFDVFLDSAIQISTTQGPCAAFSLDGLHLATFGAKGVVIYGLTRANGLRISDPAVMRLKNVKPASLQWDSTGRVILYTLRNSDSIHTLSVTKSIIPGQMPSILTPLPPISTDKFTSKTIADFALDRNGERLVVKFRDTEELELLVLKLDATLQQAITIHSSYTIQAEASSSCTGLAWSGTWYSGGSLLASVRSTSPKSIQLFPCIYINRGQIDGVRVWK